MVSYRRDFFVMATIRLKSISKNSDDFLTQLLTAYFLQRAAEAWKQNTHTFYHNAKRKYAKDIDKFISTKRHLKTLHDFANEFGFNVKFWNKIGKRKTPVLAGQFLAFMPRGVVNISSPNSNHIDGLVFTNCHLIIDWMKFSNTDSKKTILQILSEEIGVNKDQFWQKWDSDRISFFDERKFKEVFGFGFQIFTRDRRKDRHYKINLIYRSLHKKCFHLEFTSSWLSNKAFISIHDTFLLSEEKKYFYCDTEACTFVTDRENRYNDHKEKCTGQTITYYKQIKLTRKSAYELLVQEDYIEPDYIPKMFISYDIETINDKTDTRIFGVTKELSTQRLISIAVTKNFGDNRTVAFKRKELSEDSYFDLLREFRSCLFKFHNEFNANLPKKLKDSFEKIQTEMRLDNNAEPSLKMPFQKREILKRCYFEIKKLMELPVVGFNSEHFDLPILLPGLLRIWGTKTVDTVRRGTGIMILRLEPFVFIDARNFTAGSSLIKFGKAWGAETNKSLFPYEAFNKISELNECKNWPPYSKFSSVLSKQKVDNFSESLLFYLSQTTLDVNYVLQKLFQIENISEIDCIIPNSICPIEYLNNFIEFEKLKNSGVIQNMYDYLLLYNQKDTELLSEAFQNYINAFINTFGLSPLDYYSLPGMAERILWKNYDNQMNEAFSLPSFCGDINQIIRANLQGGLVAVFHRHVEVNTNNIEKGKISSINVLVLI